MLLFLKKGEEIGHKKSMPVNDIVKFITNDYIFQLPVLQNCKLLLRAMQPMTNEMLFPLVLRLYEEKNCTIEIRHCTHNTATSQTCIPTGTHTKKEAYTTLLYATLHYTGISHTCTQNTTHTCMHACMYTHAHTNAQTQTCTDRQTDRQTDRHAHTHTHTHANRDIHIQYTYTGMHTQTHTHMHTQTHANMYTDTNRQTHTWDIIHFHTAKIS